MDAKSNHGFKLFVVVVVIIGLYVGYTLPSLTDCSGKNEQTLYAFEKADAAKGAEAMARMPQVAQDALICWRYGLLFVPDGESGYNDEDKFSDNEMVQYFAPRENSSFVASDGKVYTFRTALSLRDKQQNHAPDWVAAVRAMGTATDEAVFASYEADVKRLAAMTVKHHLSHLPVDVRRAWLAMYLKALFSENGKNFYTGRARHQRVPGTYRMVKTREVSDAAVFAGANGQNLSFNKTLRHMESDKSARSAWKYATFCADVAGEDAVLALYPKAVSALRQEADKRNAESPQEGHKADGDKQSAS